MKNYRAMSSLLNEIKEDYNEDHAGFVADFFDNLGLPVPQYAREFSDTSDDGYMVFLSDTATMIRIISSREAPAIDHPFILQPLLRRTHGILRAELFPGVRTPASEIDTRYVAARLYQDGIEFGDMQLANVGYIPHSSSKYPKGFPVVIDQGAIDFREAHSFRSEMDPITFACDRWREDFERRRNALQSVFDERAKESVNLQDDVFGSVRKAFESAWPQNNQASDLQKMSEAWDGCRYMKDKGLFVASWAQEYKRASNFKNIFHGAANYQERCHKKGVANKEKGSSLTAKPSP